MLLDLTPHQLAIVDRNCLTASDADMEVAYDHTLDEYYLGIKINSTYFKASDILKTMDWDAYCKGIEVWLSDKFCEEYYVIDFNAKDQRIYKADEVDSCIDINDKGPIEPEEEL